MSTPDTLLTLRDALRAFAIERDWERFHTPKNLAMALSGEAGEVIEHFQWLTPEASAALSAEQRVDLDRLAGDCHAELIG